MRCSLNGLAILALFVFLAPAQGSAQCGHFDTAGCGAYHKLPTTSDDNQNPHSYCADCTSGTCHPLCNAEDFANNASLVQAYAKVLAAASLGDVARVIQLSEGIPGYVTFNAARRAVQIRACSNQNVVASLPLRSERQLQLALRFLPNAAYELAFSGTHIKAWPTGN